MQHVQAKLFLLKKIPSYCTEQEYVFSFHLMNYNDMFLDHANPKLWVSVNAIVCDLCKKIIEF